MKVSSWKAKGKQEKPKKAYKRLKQRKAQFKRLAKKLRSFV